MKIKLIIILSIVLLLLSLLFQSYRVKIQKEKVKDLIETNKELVGTFDKVIKQKEVELNDIIKQNKERIQEERKAYLLQEELDNLSKKSKEVDDYLNTPVPDDLRLFVPSYEM